MFKKIFDLNRLSTLLLYTSILTFIIAFNFSDNPPSGWYQQFLPNLNSRPLADIQFIDSLLGYGITGDHTSGDTNYIIKTTNGGDNWFVINTLYKDLSRVQFINAYTGYVSGGLNGIPALFIKTTNGGINWTDVNSSLPGRINDIFVLNEDTIWYTDEAILLGGLFRTTDAGATWVRQFYENGNIPSRIYMINSHIGFFSGSDVSVLNKTTDGGSNWSVIAAQNGFRDIYFSDSLTGWKSTGGIKKTTDGGLNWIEQTLPSGGIILTSAIRKFKNINNDTIWGVGAEAFYGSGRFRGLIYKTTNGGTSWGYQQPDTSFLINRYFNVDFINKNTGWSYGLYSGVFTVSGGDSLTIFTSINNHIESSPELFLLHQNYPNPFNPKTIINYELKISSNVKLIIYDISGKEIAFLVNQRQTSGSYEIKFDGSNISSGVYFFRLEAEDSKGNNYQETKKMILIR